MPTKLVIADGPPFKSFVFNSSLFDRGEWILTFTLDPKKELKLIVLFIGHLKRFMVPDEDAYSFIGFDADSDLMVRRKGGRVSEMFSPHLYFVGQ